MPRPEKVRLGEILLQQQLLTEAQLHEALDAQRKSGRKLGRVFVEKGFVSEDQISTALARQLQVPYVNLKQFVIKPDVASRLPETQARRFRAIVLEDGGSFYRVAMADPTDLQAYDEIARFLKRDISSPWSTKSAAADH
jgi:MSHA biogenesis protein MshE